MSVKNGNENNETPANDGGNAPYPRATSRVSKCPPYTKQIFKTHFMRSYCLFMLLLLIYYIHLGHESTYNGSVVYKLDKNYIRLLYLYQYKYANTIFILSVQNESVINTLKKANRHQNKF